MADKSTRTGVSFDRALRQLEVARNQMDWAKRNGTTTLLQEFAALAAKEAEHKKAIEGNPAVGPTIDPDADLRIDTIDALVAEGKARHVAAELTNSHAKLMAQAKRLDII